jgi:hypothetical protein
MSQVISTGKGSNRAWSDGEKLGPVSLLGVRREKIKGDDAPIVCFATASGDLVEKWATALWLRLIEGDKSKKEKPTLKEGDVLDVEAMPEAKLAGKGGKRFRPFSISRRVGKEIPKNMR